MNNCHFRMGYWIATAILLTTLGAQAAELRLPLWPLLTQGDKIPDDMFQAWEGDHCGSATGAFPTFPAKGNRALEDDGIPGNDIHPDDQAAIKAELPFDPGVLCDDGDQTLFNGLLCAADFEAGCAAVADSQNEVGKWFRSPHRAWMWNNRCFSEDHPIAKALFVATCANGFSPDQNLGVLLFTLMKDDVSPYFRWLDWLNGNARTTELCKLDGEQKSDCVSVPWPRVCEYDLGFAADNGTSVFGRYGGQCVLRPQDALDFAVVNSVKHIIPPSQMLQFEVTSRGLMLKAMAVLGGRIPPLLVMSLVEGDHFPIHLDATRVLLRMLAMNPGLGRDLTLELPDFDPSHSGTTATDLDAIDPVATHLAAVVLAERGPTNPFYQLLAEGPTDRVRKMILDSCPTAETVSTKREWIWEKSSSDTKGRSAEKSIGWDCIFVGKLYNKMRVSDGVPDVLRQLLQNAIEATKLAVDTFDDVLAAQEAALKSAETDLQNAHEHERVAFKFVAIEYDKRVSETRKKLDEVRATARGLYESAREGDTRVVEEYKRLVDIAKALPGCFSFDLVCIEAQKLAKETLDRLIGEHERVLGELTKIVDTRDRQSAELAAELVRLRTLNEENLSLLKSGALKLAINEAEGVVRRQRRLFEQLSDPEKLLAQLEGLQSVWLASPPTVPELETMFSSIGTLSALPMMSFEMDMVEAVTSGADR